MSDCSSNAFKMPEKPELLPCPLCWNKARYYSVSPASHQIECAKCGLATKSYIDKEEAIEAWNTRYQPTSTYEEIEKQYYRCTNCGYEVHYYEYPPDEGEFCKGCGARVEVVD